MKLSTKSRYGLRAMVELAGHHGQGALAMRQIAQDQDLPGKYLEILFNSLKVAGIVRSRRGSKGGWSLDRPPENIRLGEIMQALEGPIDVAPCVLHPDSCGRADHCPTRYFYVEINEAILGVFDRYTLEDLRRRKIVLDEDEADHAPDQDLCSPASEADGIG